jgi:hypothetical protein
LLLGWLLPGVAADGNARGDEEFLGLIEEAMGIDGRIGMKEGPAGPEMARQ